MTIRKAEPSDASSIAAVGIETWITTYLRDGVNAHFADYALASFTAQKYLDLLKNPAEQFWVSQNKTGIDGFLRLTTGKKAPVGDCSDCELTTLYVQPSHQDKGIGGGLLRAALTHAAATGMPRLWLAVNTENTRATRFYQRYGFVTCGTTAFTINDQSYPNLVMVFAGQGAKITG